MANLSGKATAFLFGAYDLSAYLNTSDVDRTIAALETTTYGATGSSKTFIPGLSDGKVTAGGLFDGSATGINATLQPILAAGTISALTHAPQGVGTIGNSAFILQAECTDYKAVAPVAGVVNMSASFQASGGIWGGFVLEPLTAHTNAGNSASSVDNGASSANGGVATLHVPAYTSGTATIKVQHSTDNSTWADLITFTAVAGVTSQFATVAGTVNRYVRYLSTGTYVCTFTVAFARQ